MTSRLVTAAPLVIAVLGSVGMVAFPAPQPGPAVPGMRWNVCRTDHVKLPGRKGEFWSTAAHRPRTGLCWG